MIKVKLHDGSGRGHEARVSSRGELIVAPLNFSAPYNALADVANTAYNLVTPISGQRFIITAILLYGNKNVGAADATVTLYEATSATTTTVDKAILTVEIPKNVSKDLTGLNLGVTAGRWINVKTDDDDVYCTIFGYYAEV